MKEEGKKEREGKDTAHLLVAQNIKNVYILAGWNNLHTSY